ncbi:MAG: exodeoxyribonuclease VII small subunit [Solirubrobacteraceae bacterium]
MSATKELTFEAGYERLRTIAERINKEEVPVSEMCDLFAEGKGLEQALTGYLDTQTQRVQAIERGEGVQAFRIVAPVPSGSDLPIDDDFVPAPVAPERTPAPGDDDIPF